MVVGRYSWLSCLSGFRFQCLRWSCVLPFVDVGDRPVGLVGMSCGCGVVGFCRVVLLSCGLACGVSAFL